MNRAIVLSVCLSVILAVGSLLGQEGNTVSADITIGTSSSGDCVVTGSPDHMRSAKRNYKVVWNVTNRCDTAKTVTVDNFKHENAGNQKKDPIRIDKVDTVGPGGTGTIEGRVKGVKDEDLGTYKYDILIDKTVAEDPKIDIDG